MRSTAEVVNLALRPACCPAVHVFAIAAMVLILYSGNLGSYFLADDIGEVSYVSHIAAGNVGLLWSNFTGNYLQIPVLEVYRPWLIVTLVLDFLLWGPHAAGYYADNILHFFGCCLFLYLLVKELTVAWGPVRSSVTALFSALIFAAHPLHSESVSWVVGRVDVVCLMYYLLSLLLVTKYLVTRKPAWLWFAVVSVVPAILTKEMAVGLPVVAAMIAFLWKDISPNGTGDAVRIRGGSSNRDHIERTLGRRLHLVLKVSAPLFAVVFIYLLVRYLALGTLIGGYQGSIGASHLDRLVARWLDPGSLERLMLPLNAYAFSQDSLYRLILTGILVILVSWTALRVICVSKPYRWISLLCIWMITCLLPVSHLWGLGPNLDGSRFLFFLTAPMSVVFPVLLFAPRSTGSQVINKEGNDSGLIAQPADLLSASVLLVFSIVLGLISQRNNLPWVQAGDEVRSLKEQAVALANTMDENEKLALVGIPKRRGGAHMIYNGDTFDALVSPPFTVEGYRGRFLTFDPLFFGSFDWINSHHFKKALRDPNVYRYYRWESEKRNFVPLEPGSADDDVSPIEIPIRHTPGQSNRVDSADSGDTGGPDGTGAVSGFIKPMTTSGGADLVITGLDLFPAKFDFLEISTTHGSYSSAVRPIGWIGWRSVGGESKRFPVPAIIHRRADGTLMRFKLSDHWQWYGLGQVKSIRVEMPALKFDDLRTARLVNGAVVAPVVGSPRGLPNHRGVYPLRQRKFSVDIDCTRVPGAGYVELEVYRPNHFIDDYTEGTLSNALWKRTNERPRQAVIRVDLRSLEVFSGYIQTRARCLDDRGTPIGEYSDILTFQTP